MRRIVTMARSVVLVASAGVRLPSVFVFFGVAVLLLAAAPAPADAQCTVADPDNAGHVYDISPLTNDNADYAGSYRCARESERDGGRGVRSAWHTLTRTTVAMLRVAASSWRAVVHSANANYKMQFCRTLVQNVAGCPNSLTMVCETYQSSVNSVGNQPTSLKVMAPGQLQLVYAKGAHAYRSVVHGPSACHPRPHHRSGFPPLISCRRFRLGNTWTVLGPGPPGNSFSAVANLYCDPSYPSATAPYITVTSDLKCVVCTAAS